MARRHHRVEEESFPIPPDAYTFEGFWRWLESDEFPESGRIDFLDGEISADMSPEDLQTHGVLKVEIGSKLHALIREQRLGQVFVDSTRVSSPGAGLSAEPDVVVVLWESLRSGTACYVQSPLGPPAIEGAPDLVVEVVSRSSETKDRKLLPPLYARAGIPELWLVDARGRGPQADVKLEIFALGEGGYAAVEPEADGWLRSVSLPFQFRLRREPDLHPSTWLYTLEHDSKDQKRD
jgi:Uma2 family endonuclease